MNTHPELSQISQITNNIFVSGAIPLNDVSLIKKLNIKCILSCVNREYISQNHDKIMMDDPDIMILYLPCNDDVRQNLWEKNKNKINVIKYVKTISEHDKILQQLSKYNNKPLIEIGYHFINNAISLQHNVLVHCMAGISRSVSMITYFLMKKYNMNYEEAIKLIKNKRCIANPNQSFKLQLQKYHDKKDQFNECDAKIIIVSLIHRNV